MLNKSTIDKMLDMPDERLWSMIRLITSAWGVSLNDKQLDSKKLRRLRALLSEITDNDIERVLYLSERYKNGGDYAG